MNKNYPWRTGRSCQYRIYYHLVFVTKYRRNVFTLEIINRLKTIFDESCKQLDGELLEFNGEDDHIHLMAICPPKLSLSTFVGKLKGKSAYLLRKEYGNQLKKKLWGNNLWSPSYCIVSCGGAPLNIVKQYIENQRTPPSQRSVSISIRESNGKYSSSNAKESR